jgi:DNA-binding NarL/FixJ family response regulator
MTWQPSLWSYPATPGAKEHGGTSADAARSAANEAEILRERVLDTLRRAPAGMTADEVAAQLGRSVLSVRPRVSELVRVRAVRKTGRRRRNSSGMSAAVWEVWG